MARREFFNTIIGQLVTQVDVNARNFKDETPLSGAVESGAWNNITTLLSNGAKVDIRGDKGQTRMLLEYRHN